MPAKSPKSISPAPTKTTRAKITRALLCVSLAFALPLTTACVVLTAATAAVVDISLDRRTPGTYLDDNLLEKKLRADIKRDELLHGTHVNVTTFNGMVLLTGQTQSDAQRRHAGELAARYQPSGDVNHIVNELELSGNTNITSRINDRWINSKVKARLFKAKGLSPVKVTTEHGKVYLFGRVTAAEAEQAIATTRDVAGITHIVKVFQYIEE